MSWQKMVKTVLGENGGDKWLRRLEKFRSGGRAGRREQARWRRGRKRGKINLRVNKCESRWERKTEKGGE